MSGGTGVSSLGSVMSANTSSSLLQSAYPIESPHSLGGNTHIFESRGGYYPGKENKRPKMSRTHHVYHSIQHKKKKHTPPSPKTQRGGKKRKSKSMKNRTRKNFS